MNNPVSEKILLVTTKEIFVVEIMDIVCFTTIKGDTVIETIDRRKYLLKTSMAKSCNLIDKPFIRKVCRKYALNMYHFIRFDVIKSELHLTGDISMKLSVRQKNSLIKALEDFFPDFSAEKL
jgi:hypothetical protein